MSGSKRARRSLVGHVFVDAIVHLFHELESLEDLLMSGRAALEQVEVALQQQVILGDAQDGQLQVRGHFQTVAVFQAYLLDDLGDVVLGLEFFGRIVRPFKIILKVFFLFILCLHF